MVGEVFAGIGAFKAMFDMAKGLGSIHDAAARDRAVIELQKEILAAQAAQFALIEQIGTLKADVAKFEAWDSEKKKYSLKDLGSGALAYMLKPDARSGEPPHWVCTNCYSNRRISIIQHTYDKKGGLSFLCQACFGEVKPSREAFDGDSYKWLD